jgi:dTDP-4-amino-4,6-dideoxygalactose transaminase
VKLPIPYARHHVTPEDEEAVLRVLRSDYLTQGPEVERFEEELAEMAGARYAVAVNSGTAALHLAYLAAGAKPGVKVYMPAISFVATANAARMCGAEVRFWDCDQATGLADTDPRGDVRVVVTLGGTPCNFPIVDACHGPIRHGDGIATIFSFHPAKHVSAGEGGAIVTNDQGFADYCRTLRSHGRLGAEAWALGFNYRMPDMNAALARSQLQRYAENVRRRQELAKRYDDAFRGRPQSAPHHKRSARHLYQILVDKRDSVQIELKNSGIVTAVHYPVIPHQPAYRSPGSWPNAQRYAERTLSLPLYPTLTEQEQDYVIEKVLEAVA